MCSQRQSAPNKSSNREFDMFWHCFTLAYFLIFLCCHFWLAGSAVSKSCMSHSGPAAFHSFKQDASPFTNPQPLPTLCPCPLPGQLWGGRPFDDPVRRKRESIKLSLWEEIAHSHSHLHSHSHWHWLTTTAVHKFRAVVSKLPQTGCYILEHDQIYTIICIANLKCIFAIQIWLTIQRILYCARENST